MQKLLGIMRKGITDYQMIENGDRICVGVSGGKDSVALLKGLVMLKRFIGIEYEIIAVTLDLNFFGQQTDYSPIEKMCEDLGVEYIIKRTQIGEIVFDTRKESHPCSLCARMRRGALHDAANELNCNSVALGHHKDDAVETFFMNLFNEGRIGCFSPKSYLSRKDLNLIRPLVFAEENDIEQAVKRNCLPIVKNKCPVDGCTSREKTKEFISERQLLDNSFKNKVFGAMIKSHIDKW